MSKQKVASEMKTRKVFLELARHLKCEVELKMIFKKYDDILRRCTNQQEVQHIQALAVAEVDALLQSAQKLDYNIMQPPDVVKKLNE